MVDSGRRVLVLFTKTRSKSILNREESLVERLTLIHTSAGAP
uniref:Uncharacterized protein n=1 Tax=Amphimedon queenslandica TaxID=400682 RepID=A0A1X7VLT2_AMPQE